MTNHARTFSLLAAALLSATACRITDRSPGGTADRRGDEATADSATVCPTGSDSTLVLPAGFCATIVADSLGTIRHIAVAPNGDLFVVRRGAAPGQTGTIAGLRDINGDGRADTVAWFGTAGGTGIGLYRGYLYVDARDRIVRYPLPAGNLLPAGEPEAIVINLPPGGHEARNFVIDPGGALYVNIGSLSNSCQQQDRGLGSPGFDPCTELATRAGIWRFDAEVPGQVPDSSNRFATGIRNAMGMAVHPADGLLYATQHGRDQFFQNWPELFNEKYSAENPAEVLVQVSRGDDFGWPYCYHLGENGQMVVAPEYGGDGRRTDRCSAFKGPVAFFPGHWAPMDLLFYTGNQFPEKYRGGAFIPFHGSWNRAPEPQDGFRVVFQPFSAGRPAGKWETFADGFAGALKTPDGAVHRPMGVAQAPDGSLYVTDDRGGRIWRISWARR